MKALQLPSAFLVFIVMVTANSSGQETPAIAEVAGQPLGASAVRVVQALEYLGAPLPAELTASIHQAARERDATRLQQLLDPHVLVVVSINPEQRVRVARGPAPARLMQAGFTPQLVKVLNEATATQRLSIHSPQAGPVYGGALRFSLERQQQTELADDANEENDPNRFLHVEMFSSPPLGPRLSGLAVEYAVALVYSSEAGKREATLRFDIGQGTEDLGFRAEVPVLFDIAPAIPVRLQVRDHDGEPTVARLEIRDAQGHVYPPQAKRLAPDFFFQPQIYREDGDQLLLPPGRFRVRASRGPEYREQERVLEVPSAGEVQWEFHLERWVDPLRFGWYGGDHHIHAAGCAHYQIPTEGVGPRDIFRQVKGEGLSVGCVLTWGYCFDHQRRFFSSRADTISEPRTVLKYDLEISGFGSAPMGHVCLLNLRDQTYPGTEASLKGWPSWTVPVMRWAKEQGGVTGYPHSDMQVDEPDAARRLVVRHDANRDAKLAVAEAATALLPEPFAKIDSDEDGQLSEFELVASMRRAADQLPNLVPPAMNGAGAMEVFVSTAEGVCDFISAMDTGRVGEWNTWYHLMNCGFPLKLSGETDFPCMSSRRIGQGRVYVQLGECDRVDFHDWCLGLARGRSYVCDGYAHALEFTVNGTRPGESDVTLAAGGEVDIQARVAFAPETPRAVAHGTLASPARRRDVGDTRVLHGPRDEALAAGGKRLVEVVANGQVVASQLIPADGESRVLSFRVPVQQSSWVALRQFPQLHTNPVNVIVGDRPIRASAASARWCAEAVELLWEKRQKQIAEGERPAAQVSYEKAAARFRELASECEAR